MGRNNRRVKGGRGPVLEKFRTDQSIRALLLPVSAGANGINLTEATPSLPTFTLRRGGSPSNRTCASYRTDQNNDGHHFYIKDTESRIVARTSE